MNRTSGKSRFDRRGGGRLGARLRTRPRRRGVSAVEFALVLPVLLTLVGGAVDFGRCFYTYVAVTNAARAGAEYASTNPVTTNTLGVWISDIEDVVARELGDRFTETPDVEAQMPDTEADGMRRIRVEVSYPFETIVTWPGVPHQFEITQAVEMRVIRY